MIADPAWKSALLHRSALQQQPWLATCPVHAGRWIS